VQLEKSLSHLEVSATRPYPEPDQASQFSPFHFITIDYNVILPSTPRSANWSPSLRFLHQNSVCTCSCSSYVLHDGSILFFLMWYYLVGTDHKTPR